MNAIAGWQRKAEFKFGWTVDHLRLTDEENEKHWTLDALAGVPWLTIASVSLRYHHPPPTTASDANTVDRVDRRAIGLVGIGSSGSPGTIRLKLILISERTPRTAETEMNVPLRDKINSGETAFGVWSTIPSEAMARMVASTPGISWFVIDAEHGQYNDTHLYTHTTAIASLPHPSSVSPIVRIPIDSDWWIKRALDAGAHGILVPLLRTPDQVREVVRNAKYPPRGVRGFGPMYTHHAFGCAGVEYKAGADENLFVIIQIENTDALANVEEIAQIDGVDVLFIGPYDLSLSLGVNFGGDEHEAAIAKILAAAHKYGKKAAMYCNNGDQACARAAQGFDLVSVVTDIDILTTGFANALAAARGVRV